MITRPPASRIVIIGAGPGGLSVAAALVDRSPDLRRCLTVVDPSGRWLDGWERQFAIHQIEHLRSAAVHHPDPAPYALIDYERVARRPPGSGGFVRDGGFDLPSTRLFADFCDEIIERFDLEPLIASGSVAAIEPCSDAAGSFTARLADGRSIDATHLVHAGNPRTRVLPDWAVDTAGQILHPCVRHSTDVDLRSWAGQSRRVLVVGGGLTAVQLAVGACRAGSEVVLASRRPISMRPFDVEGGWLGPKYLAAFEREEDWSRRRSMIDEARGGGSIPPFARRQLDRAIDAGGLVHREGDEVAGLSAGRSRDRQAVVRWSNGQVEGFDEVWLATGSRPDVLACPVVAQLHDLHPVEVHRGIPVVGEDLQWADSNAFVVGAAAALRLGPTAGILAGQRRAANRIATAILGVEPIRIMRRAPLSVRSG